jgi:hypothetical protein
MGVMAETPRKTEQTEWTPERLREAVVAGSRSEKVELLKQIGVLTAAGKLSKRSEQWGNRPSRTPELEKSTAHRPTNRGPGSAKTGGR